MKEQISKLKKIYIAAFLGVVLIAGVILVLKKVMNYPDYDDIYKKISTGVMLFVMALILAAVFLYSYFGKKSKELEDEEKQLKLYLNAAIIKLALIELVGTISAIMLFLKYQETYLYMVGIVLVFILVFLPSELRFKKDFTARTFES